MKENSVNIILSKLVISVRGDHCGCLPQGPENLATPFKYPQGVLEYSAETGVY